MRENYIKKLLASGYKEIVTKGNSLRCFVKEGIYIFVGLNRIIRVNKNKGAKGD